MHNYIREDLIYRYNWLTAFVFSGIWYRLVSKHDKVVTLSRNMMEYYRSVLSNRNITYIYNGREEVGVPGPISKVDRELIEAFRKERCMIGAVCALDRTKGLEHVVKYLSKNEGYGFLVIGAGPEKRKILKLAKNLNVLKRTLFLGYRPNAVQYFSYFDIYAMPSRSEGFPLSLIEAASLKKPVICSDIGVFKEIFTDEEVAFFHLDDIESFAAAIERLRRNMSVFSNNIYRKYRQKYTAKIAAENYLKLYESLL